MKKIISLALALLTMLCTVACGGGSKPVDVSKLNVPTFDESKVLHLSTEIPPDYSYEENVLDVAELGIDTLFVGEDYFAFGSESFKQAMKWCEKHNMRVMIRIHEKNLPIHSNQFDGDGWPTNEPTYFETYVKDHINCKSTLKIPNVNGQVDEEYLEAHADCPMLDFKDYPAVVGFYLLDEPSYKQTLEIRANYVDWFNEYYGPEYEFNVAFTMADNAYLQGHDLEGNVASYDKMITEYQELTMAKVNSRAVHHVGTYPVKLNNGKTTVSERWLKVNMDAALYAEKYNAELQLITGTFEGYQDVKKPESVKELEFVNYVNFLFGAKANMYWGYRTANEAGLTYHMMSDNGKKTELYYLVKETNQRLANVDHVLMHFNNWDGLFTYVGSGNKTATEKCFEMLKTDIQPSIAEMSKSYLLSNLTDVTAFKAKYNVIAGEMSDDAGQKAYVIVNYDNIELTRTNKVKMTFEKADGVMLCRDGAIEIIGLANHEFEIELDNAEPIILVPLYQK